MSDSQGCLFEGCDSTGRMRRGLCRAHYEQQRKGLPLTPIRWRWHAKDGASCSFDGCGRPVQSVGLCSGHYDQQKKSQELRPLRVTRPSDAVCEFDGCERLCSVAGLCGGHYAQQSVGRELSPLRERRASVARDVDGRKQCRGCDVWKPEDAFTKSRKNSDGLHIYCKRCVRDQQLLTQYNITIDDYDAMSAAQGGVCAICKTPDPAGKELAVDHDHSCCSDPAKSCGECVRGLLCWSCNVGIGHLRDDPKILTAAAAYLAA